MSEARALFDRLVTMHRPDCELLASAGSFAATPAIDQGTLARDLESDAAGSYAVAARVVFEDLRRIVGQLAGFLILARLTRRRELLDLPEMDAARQRWQKCVAGLSALTVPSPLAEHRRRLEAATICCGEVLAHIEKLGRPDRTEEALDQAGDRIKEAYRALQTTASEKAGLAMVDFSHACCSCGPQH